VSPIASFFVGTTEGDFIGLPCPASVKGISHVVALLDEIREAFQTRLTELQSISNAMTLEARKMT
jgi:hypothetical protein